MGVPAVTGYSFPRTLKLLQSSEFKLVFDRADLKAGAPALLLLARYNELGHPRLGLVVGKKNARLAVARNRIKRQARESFRLRQASLPSMDIVFLARKGVAELSRSALKEQLEKAWRRLERDASKEARSCAG